MSLYSERDEINGIVTRLLDNLSLTVSSQVGIEGAAVRRQIGDLRSNYYQLLTDGIFTEDLLACFTAAREANVKLASIAYVREQLFLEVPTQDISEAIVQAGIIFCLAAESRLITAFEFASRDDVDAMIKAMRLAFDTAREIAADAIDSASYQSLTFLAGSLMNHLNRAALPLPRMIDFHMAAALPTLALSQRLYYVGDRAEEILSTNKIIHPAFALRDIRGLSA